MPLVDKEFIVQKLTHEAAWCRGHGAEPDSQNLGFGMVYYALVYALRARICCVLGSGGGFLPRVLRQAQIDAGIDGKTIVIDADLPSAGWGKPDWTAEDSFFRTTWPEIEWWKETTEEAANKFLPESISFLHIDADHRRVLKDFLLYAEKIEFGGILSIHDTATGDGCDASDAVERIRLFANFEDCIDFMDIGAGIALIRRLW